MEKLFFIPEQSEKMTQTSQAENLKSLSHFF